MNVPTIPLPDSRCDERDTMFARAARRKRTRPYGEYYARKPELQPVDDWLRSMPPLLSEGTVFFDPEISAEAERFFEAIPAFEPEASTVAHWAESFARANDPAAVLKDMALALGAVAAGVAEIDEEFVYSHRGRHDQHYGETIEPSHTRALVFLVEMDHQQMGRSPTAEVIRESAKQYYRSALISLTMCAVLERAGHAARSQHDAHYDLILPPLAVKAGLGELGRNNILIADRYGSRVRIGAVSLSLPLALDDPVDLGAAYFCEICKKCADNCPSKALSVGERVPVRGINKWPTKVESCYAYWRRVGTDCGICMASCPFSHKNNAFHNLVRWGIRHSRLFARFGLWCDDLIYGRKWMSRRFHS